MKLKKFLLFMLSLTIFACSTESVDSPKEENPTDNTLLKKIIYNKGTVNEYSETYNYNGNKLMSVDAGDGYKSIFTYEADKLVKYQDYYDGELWAYMTLEYNSEGVLVQFIEYWEEKTGYPERAYRNVLTYNNDNTISRDIYLGDHDSQTDIFFAELISFDGKNISRVKDTDGTTEYIYSYDDKNGMFKNIHAIDILNLLSENEFGPYILGNTNNITSNIESYNNDNSEEIIEYVYNDYGYPKSAIFKVKYNGIIEEDQTETMDFFYE